MLGLINLAGAQVGTQQLPAASHIKRQVAVAVVVAVKKRSSCWFCSRFSVASKSNTSSCSKLAMNC